MFKLQPHAERGGDPPALEIRSCIPHATLGDYSHHTHFYRVRVDGSIVFDDYKTEPKLEQKDSETVQEQFSSDNDNGGNCSLGTDLSEQALLS